MHAHRLAYMSTEKGANTHIKTVVSAGQCPVGCSRQLWGCSSWLWSVASMSCSGVCVWWLISSFTPGKLWSTNITHKKWRGPNDAVQHNLASHIPRDVPQDVNLSIYFKRACWFFFCNITLSLLPVYLGVFEATAESVAVALVTDFNVVNLVLIQQHQGEGVLDWAFRAVPHHKGTILKCTYM